MFNFINKNIPKFKGTSRTVAAKKNIFLLFFFSGFNFLFNLLLVRLSLEYLGQESYGIWVTLASILTWFSYLDFGLGNGLRNKLTEAFARNEYDLAKIYVSTTYVIFSFVLILLYIIFLLIYNNISWTSVFNTSPLYQEELTLLAFYVFTFFTVSFILRLITFIVLADQKPALNGLFNTIVNSLTVLLVYILINTIPSSLLYLGAGASFIPVIVFAAASFILFKTKYKAVSPSIRFINFKYSKDLINLGFQFFIIQAATLVVFATDNIIITQLFGPEDVTPYNIAFRYFNYIPVIFYVILNPLWSAYTDAYVKEDFDWIRGAIKKIFRVWLVLSLIVILMIFIADHIYDIWLSTEIEIPFLLTFLMGIYAIVSNWNNIFAYFINGVGKIRLSLYSSIFVGIMNIPLSIFFASTLGWGVAGVISATLVCLLIGSVWAPMQYYKIINKKDSGIWSK